MKSPPVLIAAALLAVLALLVLAPGPTQEGSRGPEKRILSKAQASPGNSVQPSATTARRPRPHEVALGQFLSQPGQRIQIPRHGEAPLQLRVGRSSQSSNSSWLEGTVIAPAPGRFVFVKQPAGALPGPFTGVIFFPSLDHGYRLTSSRGRPVLVSTPASALACLNLAGPENIDREPQEVPADHPDDIEIPHYQDGIIPLQSLPGAAGVLYLDFDGEDGPHIGWGEFDAASFNFSNSKIKTIWERVSEDFAPFDLNVTTDFEVFLAAAPASRQRCIITPTKTAGPGGGGIAFVGSFNWANDVPCWAFLSDTKTCAEVTSHELGHTLGLNHDGRTPSEVYFPGHGSGPTSWAPIMGLSFHKNVTQWSQGEYQDANNTENDLNILATSNNSVQLRLDDHGNTPLTASVLTLTPGGLADEEGIIASDDDIDVFQFTCLESGSLDLSIAPVEHGPNLDLHVALYNSSGTLLESSRPADSLSATLTSTVHAGSYTVHVTNEGSGDPATNGYSSYASIGAFTITGSLPSPELPQFFAVAENSPQQTALGTVSPRLEHLGHPLQWSILSGNEAGIFAVHPSTGALTVANPTLLDVETLAPGWTNDPVLFLTIRIHDTIDSNLDEEIRVHIIIGDLNEAPSLAHAQITCLEHTLPGRSLLKLEASDPDEFDRITYTITGGDPNGRFTIDAGGNLVATGDLSVTEQSDYSLTITATDSGSPSQADTATIQVHLIDTVEGFTPGQVEHAYFRNLHGSNLLNLTASPAYPRCPTDLELRSELHTRHDGDAYGRIIRCYLIPPQSGEYTFWIAGNDYCQLYLSPNATPSNASLIAGFSGNTPYQNWDHLSSQKSNSISLVGGQAYYLEVRQKESNDDDHVSVAWEARDSTDNSLLISREPVSGLFLAPVTYNYCPRISTGSATIRANAVPGTVVHDFDVTDLNAGDSHQFTITSGNQNGAFAIDSASGVVSVASSPILAGNSLLQVQATDSGNPTLSATASLLVTVLSADAPKSSGVLIEIWEPVNGNAIANLLNSPRFPDRPDRLIERTTLDSGKNLGDAYGARMRAWLTVPTTGSYTFYLAADEVGSLLLSSDDDPANATEIIATSAPTPYRDWTANPNQQVSDPVPLIAGDRYFLEVRLKDVVGGDHIAVGWTGPGIPSPQLIPSNNVEAYDSNVAPSIAQASPAHLSTPASAGTLIATLSASDSPFEEITFIILDGDPAGTFTIDPATGELRLADPATLHCGPYTLTIGAQDRGHGGHFPLRMGTTELAIYLDDSDQDSLADHWETSQFGNLEEDAEGDSDNDDASNRMEFVLGSDPNDFLSLPAPEAQGDRGPVTARFYYRRRTDLAPGTITHSHSTDFVEWTTLGPGEFTTLSVTPDGPDHEQVVIEVPFTSSHCFLRLGVTP